jgi:hypothetical protein
MVRPQKNKKTWTKNAFYRVCSSRSQLLPVVNPAADHGYEKNQIRGRCALYDSLMQRIKLQDRIITSAKTQQKKNLLLICTVTVDLYSSCVILESLDQRKTNKKDFVMTTLNSNFGMQYAPTPFLVRLGRREVLVTRDFRKRFYPVNPVIECDTGVEPGHVEVLLLRRWLLILSKAH